MAKAPPLPVRRERGPRFMGRYELIGELARGGMGTVYLARHAGEAGFQRMFAIKVLHEHLAEEAAFVDMLRDEARIAARIHHPNVVAVVDLGTHGNQHYVVMEYVEGPSFATLWKRSAARRPLDLMTSIIIDTLEGLHAAHTLKDDEGDDILLVHRDVSPQNILIGHDGVARITDFGVAKAESRISSTQPGTRKGKLLFMSPEQITDAEAIDRRTDVWAMGVVMWTILTGENLFRAENDAATIHAVLTKEILPPSKAQANPPACYDEIVLKALERDPAKRFSSALEMADELRRRATENNLLGSRHDIAKWVEEMFGEELDRRRKAIREVVRRRSGTPDLSDYSAVTLLPSLPSTVLDVSRATEAAVAAAAQPLPALGFAHSSAPPTAAEPRGRAPSVPPAPLPVESLPPPVKEARAWRAVALVAVVAALLAVVVVVLRPAPAAPPAPVAANPAVAAPTPTAAAPTVEAKVAREAPPAATPEPALGVATANGEPADDLEVHPRSGSVRRASRSAVARPAAARPAAAPPEKPSAPPPETPKPAAVPQPAPADDFEKNPYLGH